MTKIISILNHKGGVGKTTTTYNLGKALSLLGQRVLLIDTDYQANMTAVCNIDVSKNQFTIYHLMVNSVDIFSCLHHLAENLDILPCELAFSEAEKRLESDTISGNYALKTALEVVLPHYDYILIDCPPSLGSISINALVCSTHLLITVQASYLSIKGLQTLLEVHEKIKRFLNPNLQIGGMLLTQVNHTVVRKHLAESMRELYQGNVFEIMIRQNVALEEAALNRQSIFEYAPKSSGAEDYWALAKEVLERF